MSGARREAKGKKAIILAPAEKPPVLQAARGARGVAADAAEEAVPVSNSNETVTVVRPAMPARYGSLHPAYQTLLDSFPTDCLPPTVPTAKHQYHIVRMNSQARFTVLLKQRAFLVLHPSFDHVSMKISMNEAVGGPGAAWIKARSVSAAWIRDPGQSSREANDIAKQALAELSN